MLFNYKKIIGSEQSTNNRKNSMYSSKITLLQTLNFQKSTLFCMFSALPYMYLDSLHLFF